MFYPGEVEFRKEQDRRKNGVPMEDATWNKLRDLAQGYGIDRQTRLLNGADGPVAFIGQSTRRLEDERFLTGRGTVR